MSFCSLNWDRNTPHKARAQRAPPHPPPGSGQWRTAVPPAAWAAPARWPAAARRPCSDLSGSQAEPSQPELTAPRKETASGHRLWSGGARAQPGKASGTPRETSSAGGLEVPERQGLWLVKTGLRTVRRH